MVVDYVAWNQTLEWIFKKDIIKEVVSNVL